MKISKADINKSICAMTNAQELAVSLNEILDAAKECLRIGYDPFVFLERAASQINRAAMIIHCRVPRGTRGLNPDSPFRRRPGLWSRPARDAWIETLPTSSRRSNHVEKSTIPSIWD